MKHSLPWESVPPPIYPAQLSLKPRKKWVQTGGWILVVVLLLFGISTRSRNPLLAFVSLAFSVLYLLTLMTKKDAALTSRGLEIYYDMQFTTNYEFFPWEDINAIVCEDRGHADMVRLHIGHGNTEKALFFPREDLDEIYAFIKKKNSVQFYHCTLIVCYLNMVITHNKENFFRQKTIDFAQKCAILFPERSCRAFPQAERHPRTGMRGK